MCSGGNSDDCEGLAMASVREITIRVVNAHDMAERMSAIAVLAAKIGALCEDVAKEMRVLASMGDTNGERTTNASATNESIGTSDTSTSA